MCLIAGHRNTKMAKTCPYCQCAHSPSGKRHKHIILTQCGTYSTIVHVHRALWEHKEGLPNST